ncbi:MAG TPA: hypothetical protein VGN86_17230 [Pyrinomonadaceae bacterium]|nr:hypothetical protein [Pyrinomonadaceae bacterium]
MTPRRRTNSKRAFKNRIPLSTLAYGVLGTFLLTAMCLVVSKTETVSAISESASQQAMNPEQVAGTIKANAQALKAFNHQQRMQLQLKRETKKVTLSQISYDINGNQQKTQLSEDPPADAPPSGGRLKQRVVARKTGEFKDLMNDIAALVKSYTELPPEQLQASLKQAAFSPGAGDMAGSVQIVMRNVIQSGDSMTIWIDRTAMLYRRAVIATTYEGNPVTLTANYAMLPTGQVYMAQAILNYPKKQVVVEIDNSNYQR